MAYVVPSWIDVALSTRRFTPYLRLCDGDVDEGLALYRWNIEISRSFYVPLDWVEMTTRNALHARLSTQFGRDDWWTAAPLDANGERAVSDAYARVTRTAAFRADLCDAVVAELSLGFWVSLLASRHHRTLWIPALATVFPRRSRQAVHEDYQHVRELRNRVMHFEPIYRRDLGADHERLCRLIRALCPGAAREMAVQDDVPEVLARRPTGGDRT